MTTYKQKMEAWKERRKKFSELHDSGLSFNEIGDKQNPRITGQAVRRLIEAYKNESLKTQS